jgi:hypothetical protein
MGLVGTSYNEATIETERRFETSASGFLVLNEAAIFSGYLLSSKSFHNLYIKL